MTFLHAAFLFGFAALAIPPVVHLLNRRRYETVPWAAVMFLPESTTTRQRFRFQHFPLMLLRMCVLALLALAFASPQFPGCHAVSPGVGRPRDILVLVDGSASMARGTPGQTSADRAKEYLRGVIDTLGPQQRIAIRVERRRPFPVLDEFTTNRELARNSLDLIPQPSGTVEWPAALQQAYSFLECGNGECEIIILTDDQRYGWADAATLPKWGLLGQSPGKRYPTRVVAFAGDAATEGSNARLDPVRTDRATAVTGREIRFRSAVHFSGTQFATAVRISIDGSPVNTLNITPREGELNVPVEFSHRFQPGSHLVSLELSDDSFPCDNRQDFALEVLPVIPVLIVDGSPTGPRRGKTFLSDALAPSKDPTPAFLVNTASVVDWQPGLLQRKLAGSSCAPRAVALLNVDKPTADQARQIEKYVRDGGSVFIALGENCDVQAWNRVAFRGGEGFLPARVVNAVEGSTSDPPRPMPNEFVHPALEIFKEQLPGGLGTAAFPKYWRLDPNAGARGSTGTVIAAFTNRDPWLIESASVAGRVLVSAHPFDDTWKTNLHRLPDFVRLVHELFYYLSGTRSIQRNLHAGQPILFRPAGDEAPGEIRVRFPDGRLRYYGASVWPLAIDHDGDPGAYQITTLFGRQTWYAVGSDPRESDFTPNSRQDKERVAESVGKFQYLTESEPLRFDGVVATASNDLWWLPLMIVFALLLGEVLVTRRLVRSGEHFVPEVDGR